MQARMARRMSCRGVKLEICRHIVDGRVVIEARVLMKKESLELIPKGRYEDGDVL